MMDFEDQHEVEEDEEEMEEEEEDDEEDDGPDLLSTNCDSSHPNCSSRQFKMPIEARSQSPPPLPLSLSFPAGKRPSGPARYRECLKNHAVGLGGHAVDGCCEFMPAGPGGTLDALKCAACSCHRNFHRKEADPAGAQLQIQAPAAYFAHPQHPGAPRPIFQFYPYGRPGPGGYHHQRPVAMALPSTSGGVRRGGGGEAEEVSAPAAGMELGKRRHRTKFTAEQKEKMLELAEKLGWRLQKQDEPLIQHFCDVSGIKRHVLKVWMHNNKHTLGKRNPS